MSNGKSNERLSIRDSAKALKKYGSTSRNASNTSIDKLIKHCIQSSDTLQGIALKYGVTMEQLRRLNRLWASDSLFLKEYLLVPIKDAPSTSSSSSHDPKTEPDERKKSSQQQDSVVAETASTSTHYDDPSVDEFLQKLDKSIAITKKNVEVIQTNSELFSEEEIRNTDYNVGKRKAQSRLKQSTIVKMTNLNQYSTSTFSNRGYQQLVDNDEYIFSSSTNNNYSGTTKCNGSETVDRSQTNAQQTANVASNSSGHATQTVPMIVTQNGRKLKTSLQKIDRQHDEIFEL